MSLLINSAFSKSEIEFISKGADIPDFNFNKPSLTDKEFTELRDCVRTWDYIRSIVNNVGIKCSPILNSVFPDIFTYKLVIDNREQCQPEKLCVKISDTYYTAYALFYGEFSNSIIFNTKTNTWEKRRPIPGKIYEHNTNPLDYLDFKHFPTECIKEDTVMYGIELETEKAVMYKGGELSSSQIHTIDKRISDELGNDYVILLRDGSLARGGSGVEIVTAPATFKYHKTKWDTFFNGVAKELVAWPTGRCGMHVHISRNAFTPLHLGRMLAFYNMPANQSFIANVAGRVNKDFANFNAEHPMVMKLLGSSQKIGIKLNQAVDNTNTDINTHKYYAVNLVKRHTIEIRIFRANLSKVGFFKNLEFVDAVYNYTKDCRFKPMGKLEAELHNKRLSLGKKLANEEEYFALSYTDFIKWVDKDTTKRYTNLKYWLTKNNYLNKVIKEPNKNTPKEAHKFYIKDEDILKQA